MNSAAAALLLVFGASGSNHTSSSPRVVQFTVSGHSSGGSMASQHFVAFSDRILGLGHLQAAPYACSKQSNRQVCTTRPQSLDVNDLISHTNAQAAKTGAIANPSNMRERPIWVFAGARDSIVLPLVCDKAAQFYRHFSNNVKYVDLPNAQHAFITDINWSGANGCSGLRSPFINNCGYDMAGEMFKHIYGSSLNPRVTPSPQKPLSPVQLDQAAYVPQGFTAAAVGMDTRAFLYVPTGCEGARASTCRIHVMYHGCNSAVSVVGSALYTQAGFNYWAESNNILVLYPQTQGSRCWDWTGDVSEAYDTQDGLQIRTVNNMVNDLASAIEARRTVTADISTIVPTGMPKPATTVGDNSTFDPHIIDNPNLPPWFICY